MESTLNGAVRPRDRWPSHITRLLEGGVVLVNPWEFPAYIFDSLDVLALLWDRVVFKEPRGYLFPETGGPISHGYSFERFLQLVELGILIPYDWDAAVSDRRAGRAGAFWKRGEFQRILDSGNYILREEITRSTPFYSACEPLVERDRKSRALRRIAAALTRENPAPEAFPLNANKAIRSVTEWHDHLALVLNWDGVLAQALGAEVFVHPRMRPAWTYKAAQRAGDLGQTPNEPHLNAFLDRLRLDLPRVLTPAELAEFRATREAIGFRAWLRERIVRPVTEPEELAADQAYLEFRRLCMSHRRKVDHRVALLTGLVTTTGSVGLGLATAGAGGAAIGVAAALASGVVRQSAQRSARWVARKFGDWRLFFAERFGD